ncbi:MAG: precorrin-2 C(20)-methyltransferase [Planctomycetes bacterium]|nr:precorrin-2 C(20)-methyltransferase [Planctomycetota bacterium]
MDKGILYGVGVGPGDPGLLTLKAVETIRQCPVVAAPRTPRGGTAALDIAREAVDIGGKEIVFLDFAMRRDPAVRAAAHRVSVERLRPHLDAGRSVATLALGDVSLYASFRYLADRLRREGYAIRMVPGVPSFCAAAARLGTSLTDMTTPLQIIPDGAAVEPDLTRPGTVVWLKSGAGLGQILTRLDAAGRLADVAVVQRCGMAGERVFRGRQCLEADSAYFSLVILKGKAERDDA